jgi:hypothetical protein
MPNNSLRKSDVTKLFLGIGCLGISVFVLVISLVFLPSARSLLISTSTFDGFFPSGEYHFNITNSENEPVKGASLKVYEGETQNPAFEYPIDNYHSDTDLFSDESGLIIAIHRPRGFEFGGSCQHFLIVFTRCDETPKYDFVITADGYKTVKFSDEVIYELDHIRDAIGTSKVVLENGQEEEIPIFELVYVLEE